MNAKQAPCLFFLMLFSSASCAQETPSHMSPKDGTTKSVDAKDLREATSFSKELEGRRVKHYESGDFFVYREGSGVLEGSYVSMRYAEAPVKAKRLIRILESVRADRELISNLSSRLAKNRRLQRDNFTLPLTDGAGNVHRFEYIANDEHRLYTINYQFQPAED